jgi:hypothetical protein
MSEQTPKPSRVEVRKVHGTKVYAFRAKGLRERLGVILLGRIIARIAKREAEGRQSSPPSRKLKFKPFR